MSEKEVMEGNENKQPIILGWLKRSKSGKTYVVVVDKYMVGFIRKKSLFRMESHEINSIPILGFEDDQ